MINRIVLSFLLLLLPIGALAAVDSNQFTVKLLVGSDTVPPTTPTILSATPLSTTSISIRWSTSTDNFTLSGYQVFRDATQIATTSQTYYTDTGLSESTLYSYEVTAFDSTLNYSSSSAPLATTTLTTPIVPTSTPPATPVSNLRSRQSIVVNSFSIETATSTANLEWHTNSPSTFKLRWGRTTSFEEGFISSNVKNAYHETLISDLIPGTKYYYELVAFDDNLPSKIVSNSDFLTTSLLDGTAPPNVSNLEVEVLGTDVRLSWDNPDINDFAGVRVLRNHYFYPNDVINGYLIYQGKDNFVTDTGALSIDSIQYYTVYTFDDAGNISSGAVVFASTNAISSSAKPDVFIPDFTVTESPAGSDTTEPETTPKTDKILSPEQVEIWQNNVKATFAEDEILLSHRDDYVVRIPADALQSHLKSIIFTLTDPTDNKKTFSFLLKLNKDGTAYEAGIGAPNVIGQSKITADVYDFKNKTVTSVSTRILFSELKNQIKETPFFPDKIINIFSPTLYSALFGLLLLLLLLLLLFLRKRAGEDNNQKNIN